MDKLIPNTEPTSEGRTTEFKTYANYLRARIADLGRLVQCFRKHPGIQHADLRFCKVESDRGEMAANIVLSFRHLEDASMRLGKAIQAYDGGVSCYNADMGHGQEVPKQQEYHSDALSWPAGERKFHDKVPAFVQPPKAFAVFEPLFEEWARKKAHSLGWQMSSDFCQGISFGKGGVITKIFKTDAEVRDFLDTEDRKKHTAKPFTDESHSA
jgi:hypothetical protein